MGRRKYTPRRPGDTLAAIVFLPVLWPACLVYYLLSLDVALPLQRLRIRYGYWIGDVLAWSAVAVYFYVVFNWDTLTA